MNAGPVQGDGRNVRINVMNILSPADHYDRRGNSRALAFRSPDVVRRGIDQVNCWRLESYCWWDTLRRSGDVRREMSDG